MICDMLLFFQLIEARIGIHIDTFTSRSCGVHRSSGTHTTRPSIYVVTESGRISQHGTIDAHLQLEVLAVATIWFHVLWVHVKVWILSKDILVLVRADKV